MRFANILRWYSGKKLEGAQEALRLLNASIDAGEWLPGASRRVTATLNKMNEADKRMARLDAANVLLTIKNPRPKYPKERYWAIAGLVSDIHFGAFRRFAKDLDLVRSLKRLNAEQQLIATALAEIYNDFIPVAEAIQELDVTRPKPTFTLLGVSPTITKTLVECNLDLDVATLRMPVFEYFFVEVKDDKGRLVKERWIRIVWPKGTMHDRSRFAWNSSHQCHACGHAIHNPFNWVPIVMDDKKSGKPCSLWIGRDCAQRVFGIKTKGDVNIENGKAK